MYIYIHVFNMKMALNQYKCSGIPEKFKYNNVSKRISTLLHKYTAMYFANYDYLSVTYTLTNLVLVLF